MTAKTLFKFRLYFTAAIAIAIWLLLIWDHFHGGVPSHYLLQNKDLPKFSNWWGGILLPLLTWFLLYRVQKRIGKGIESSKSSVLYAFISALCFGIVLSVFFTLGSSEIPFYMMIGLLITALFLPIYRAECYLGFVIGMTFTFGGVLPIIVGAVLTLIGTVLYLGLRPGVLFVTSGLTNLVFSKKPDSGR